MSTHPGSGSDVSIQTSPHSVPSPPSWLGEVTKLAANGSVRFLFQTFLLSLSSAVRFAPSPAVSVGTHEHTTRLWATFIHQIRG